uniref:Uncharacterized protein n=1 Tax=Oryza punctata TaxID=4537 RepID=A0A0E0KYG7_ORYPU
MSLQSFTGHAKLLSIAGDLGRFRRHVRHRRRRRRRRRDGRRPDPRPRGEHGHAAVEADHVGAVVADGDRAAAHPRAVAEHLHRRPRRQQRRQRRLPPLPLRLRLLAPRGCCSAAALRSRRRLRLPRRRALPRRHSHHRRARSLAHSLSLINGNQRGVLLDRAARGGETEDS